MQPQPTLLEIRAQNIQKNEEFIRRLSLPAIQTLNEPENTANKQSKVTVLAVKKNLDIRHQYPFREKEINALTSYICNSAYSPFIISGPSGSGRTEICRSLLEKYDLKYCYIDCKCFSSVKDFFASLFRSLISTYSTEDIKESLDIKFGRNMSFENFIYSTSLLLSNGNNSPEICRNSVCSVYVVVDNIDHLKGIGKDIEVKLIRLAELSKSPIKLIAITLSDTFPKTFSYVKFEPYTMQHIEFIIHIKLSEERNPSVDIKKAIESVLATAITQTKHIGLLRNYCSSYLNSVDQDSSKSVLNAKSGMSILTNGLTETSRKNISEIVGDSLSDSWRVALISCFLCSIMYSDEVHFIVSNQRSKKRKRESTNDGEKTPCSSNMNVIPFSFERIFSVYKVLGEIIGNIDDASLASQVDSFVAQGLIVRSPMYSFERPLFYGCINQDLALDTATTLPSEVTHLLTDILNSMNN